MKKTRKLLVYVGMSGGVDSSVAAALLKKQGFNVVGVFMKPWQPKGIACLWQQDREDAMRAAAVLDIPLLTWDFSKEYGKKVARYMIDAYRDGITPNPDVMCNKEIKFGLFLNKALAEGADYIATGHYARTIKGKLLKAVDTNKDQTYFLWTLTPEQLTHTLFPVGGYTKPVVRKLAKKFKLSNHDKKDSQGICFVGSLNVKEFLAQNIKQKPGKILHIDGRELGTHDGVYYYTIGQRHGLDIGIGSGPYFVVRKDLRKNIIYVGTEQDLKSTEAKIVELSIRDAKFPLTVDVKIRYRTPSQRAILHQDGRLVFKKSQRAITPGQSAVLYRGQQVLGGGIIR